MGNDNLVELIFRAGLCTGMLKTLFIFKCDIKLIPKKKSFDNILAEYKTPLK